MKKTWKILVFVLLVFLPITFMATGCSLNTSSNSIISIEKTGSQGLTDIYTITFVDGTTQTFTVTNGKDGTDGDNVTVEDLYEEYKKIYGDDLTYSEFIDKYLSLDVGEEKTTKAINKCLLSSALVYTEFYELNSGTKQNSLYSGSAVIWSIEEDYTYFVTNYHVIYSSKAYLVDNQTNFPKAINVYLYGSYGSPSKLEMKDEKGYEQYEYLGSNIVCEYVGGSVSNDIAVIRAKTADVKAENENVSPIELAETYHIGETAIAIGNAEGEGLSVTKGIVSVESEPIELDIDKTRSYRELRIDTAIYHGNSGGGLFNDEGQLIGITNAGNGTDQNINYAIPLNVVKGMVENIMYYCKNSTTTIGSKVLLGVTVQSENIKYTYDKVSGYGKIVEDIKITNISEESITQTLGLQVDDIITGMKINGKEYSCFRSYDIGDLLLTIRVNDNISIKYKRGDVEKYTDEYKINIENLITIE